MSANLGATQMSTNSSPAAVGGNVYFTDQKKGELNELKQVLSIFANNSHMSNSFFCLGIKEH